MRPTLSLMRTRAVGAGILAKGAPRPSERLMLVVGAGILAKGAPRSSVKQKPDVGADTLAKDVPRPREKLSRCQSQSLRLAGGADIPAKDAQRPSAMLASLLAKDATKRRGRLSS